MLMGMIAKRIIAFVVFLGICGGLLPKPALAGVCAFTRADVSSAANGSESVFALDVDGDGDIDVLSASANDDTIAWYDNDGSENFTKKVISTEPYGVRAVHAADLDGDGDNDVLSASYVVDDTVSWYENDGGNNFTKIDLLAVDADDVYAVDIDGNGYMDVVSATSESISAFYQNCPIPPANPPGPNTSLNVTITIDQADPEMNELTITEDVPYTISIKLPDYDQVQGAYFRANGTKYPLTLSDNPGYYTLDLATIDLPLGTHNYTLTANWGYTTRTIYGTITVTPKPQTSPFLTLINNLFRTAYQREITMSEWTYWANRLLTTNFSSIQAIFGAMQWQALFGG